MNALIPKQDTSTLIQVVLDSVDSPETKRSYGRALRDFMAWYDSAGRPTLNKATVQRYAAELGENGLSAGNINLRLSAIRKLAGEAADNGALPETIANGIKNVKGIRQEGRRSGNWLTQDQAQTLLNTPDTSTLKGLRDRAILAILVGCGLRRQEAARLTFNHIQQRDGRWVIVDLVGKRNKTRSIPMPNWAKQAIDEWALAAAMADGYLDPIDSGYVFRSIHKGGYINGDSMSDQAIADVVRLYAGKCGFEIAAHDLRRTFAKLAHRGGSGLDQIQLSLGHASIKTTERYLGVEQDLTDAPCDRLGLRLE
jgi:site-specific recombinase XerD